MALIMKAFQAYKGRAIEFYIVESLGPIQLYLAELRIPSNT
jgi:hypothetical protein